VNAGVQVRGCSIRSTHTHLRCGFCSAAPDDEKELPSGSGALAFDFAGVCFLQLRPGGKEYRHERDLMFSSDLIQSHGPRTWPTGSRGDCLCTQGGATASLTLGYNHVAPDGASRRTRTFRNFVGTNGVRSPSYHEADGVSANNGSLMKGTYLLSLRTMVVGVSIVLVSTQVFAAGPQLAFERTWGGPNLDRATGVAIAPDGSVYVGGYTGI
jgi:hypothetical protein